LALFALAVQIVLSFAHVHLADLAQAVSRTSIVADGSGAAPSAPAPLDKSNGTVDPGCAVCALIQLAANSAPATAPVLRLPVMPDQGRPDVAVAVALAAAPHSSFQARAPPLI
jgi:hypothetical protein